MRAIARFDYSHFREAEMKKRKINLQPRRTPRQERSAQMNEIILEAATRILRKHGAASFTTNKVAEKAGISVGSLYQYYPNKEALLFRLHEREAETTWQSLQTILADDTRTQRQRISQAIHHFFVTEAEEAELRAGLKFAAVFFHESKEFHALEASIFQTVKRFLQKALHAPHDDLDFQTEFFLALVSSVAETATTKHADAPTLEKWASQLSAMICEQLKI
jgi:AcrR family transcriptional regulator